ncbi:MAG TPA: hypothetical protein VJG66_02645 [Patescibacteria group bacterium]|nr:hypothetical protein [Patescibacteria group bacterium]
MKINLNDMLILPLKFIREEDKKAVGVNLFNLAKLNHTGVSVVESVVAVPPVEIFEKVLAKYRRNYHNLKDQIGNLNRSILELEVPENLNDFNLVSIPGNKTLTINILKLWNNLLEKWANELISKIERGEVNLLEFTPQLIVFSSSFSATGSGFFDEDRGHVVINIDKGKPEFRESEEIENLILLGNRKLLLPQVFYWVIEEGKIKIIKILPFTQSVSKKDTQSEVTSSEVKKNPGLKTVTKIFLDYDGGVLNDLNCDGVFFKVDNVNVEAINEKISRILEIKSDMKMVLYPDFNDSLKNLEFAKSFLFFRNKKKLDVSIVLPRTFSKDEFIKLKTDFASVGIYSKGSLKIWKEFSTVQDFLNSDDYLEAGFDGALIDLDKIVQTVTGVSPEIFLSEPKIDQISALEKFFKEVSFTKLIKNNKLILITGKSIQNEEILNYFIKSGAWGISFPKNIIEGFREHIGFLEKQAVKKLIRN